MQIARLTHLLDNPKLIDEVVVRFAFPRSRDVMCTLTGSDTALAQPVNYPVARFPLSFKHRSSPEDRSTLNHPNH